MPRLKTPAQYVTDHETPEAAVEAAIADARSEGAAARRFKRAYTPLVEALKLSASVDDSDGAIDAARDAARDAVTALSASGDEESPAESFLQELVERLGLDLAPLETLPDGATDAQAAQALDLALKPVTERFTRGDEAVTALTQREKADAVRTAAEAIGFKNNVLGDRLTADGLTDPVVRETEQGGKKLRVAYVKDAQGAEHDLSEYARKNWTDYLPALQVQTSTATVGTEFTRQDATTTASSGGGSWVQQTLANQNKGGAYQDPLQPQTQTAAAVR